MAATSSQIRFKFKNAKDSDVVYFEGVALPLEALKASIIDKKALSASGVDLIVADASSNAGAYVAAEGRELERAGVTLSSILRSECLERRCVRRALVPPRRHCIQSSAGMLYPPPLALPQSTPTARSSPRTRR